MYCPRCEGFTTVYASDRKDDGTTYRRRRCLDCGYRFSSMETPVIKETIPDEDRESAVLKRAAKPKKVQPWSLSDLHIALRAGQKVASTAGH